MGRAIQLPSVAVRVRGLACGVLFGSPLHPSALIPHAIRHTGVLRKETSDQLTPGVERSVARF
jgi:hypothetical protein